MNPVDVWLAIGALTLITVVGRSAYLFAPPAWHPRGALLRALGYAPIAALISIAAPEVFRVWLEWPQQPAGFEWKLLFDARIVSALLLVVLLRVTRNEFLSLFAAGALFWWLH